MIYFQFRVYDISVEDADLSSIWQQTTFEDAAMKQHLKIHFTMNDDNTYGKFIYSPKNVNMYSKAS